MEEKRKPAACLKAAISTLCTTARTSTYDITVGKEFACYLVAELLLYLFFHFFNDTASTEIYTLSLHDALPILQPV